MNQLRGDLPMARALQGLERRVGSAIRRALLLLDGREDICAQLGADLVEHAACLERGRHDRREFVHHNPLPAAQRSHRSPVTRAKGGNEPPYQFPSVIVPGRGV